jgi:cobalt-zinc-cadmium efflux system membrane fusion protein
MSRIALFFIALTSITLATSFNAPAFETARPEIAIPLRDEQIRAAGIETQAVEPESETGELLVPGVVSVPPTQLRIVATPAAGLVETLLVSPDEEIQEGAPIARLRSSELIEAQRAFLHAVSDANLANEKLRRDDQLFKERIIAERRLIVTRAEAIQARSALDERQQQLVLDGMSEREIETLRHDRKLASALLVRAPMSGTILQRHGTAGERVQASAPLVTIARLDPIWVNLQIPVGRATALDTVDIVRLPSSGAEGRLIRIGRTVDSATQSITAVAEFKAAKSVLRPGQAVQAMLHLSGGGGSQWRVRADAVVHHHDQRWVFVRAATGFRAAPVTLIAETPQYASVRGALAEGDRVATRGVLTLLAELAAKDK